MSQVPFGEHALQLADLQLSALVPMEHSNGAAVEIELETAVQRTGVPRLIVSDQGSDLTKGIADYRGFRPGVAHVPGMAHYGQTSWSRPGPSYRGGSSSFDSCMTRQASRAEDIKERFVVATPVDVLETRAMARRVAREVLKL